MALIQLFDMMPGLCGIMSEISQKVLGVMNREVGNLASFDELERLADEVGNLFSQALMSEVLNAYDKKLMDARDADTFENRGIEERRVSCCFGEVRVQRRLYRDSTVQDKSEDKGYHFLLDEAIGLPPYERFSSNVKEAAVSEATVVSYRKTEATLRDMGMASPTYRTIHRWANETGEARRFEQHRNAEMIFGEGKMPPGPRKRIGFLVTEVDELFIHEQRSGGKDFELQVGLSYEGWGLRYPGNGGKTKDEYLLCGKHLFSGVYKEPEEFFEEFTAELAVMYELPEVRWLVQNGDGASWIHEGFKGFEGGIDHLDPFHWRMRVGRYLKREAPEVLEAILREIDNNNASGGIELLRAHVDKQAEEEKRKGLEVLRYLKNHEDKLVDYRRRGFELPVGMELRGVGHAESVVDDPYAKRLKKARMSWSREGAANMATLLSARVNGGLSSLIKRAIGWRRRSSREETGGKRSGTREYVRNAKDTLAGGVRNGGIPYLYGRYNSTMTGRTLKGIRRIALDIYSQ